MEGLVQLSRKLAEDDCVTGVSFVPQVKAMASLFDERTVKFKVRMKAKGLWAILKVPQRMFSQEPYSEYVAWVMDRILHYNRIPPTAWVDAVPLSMLKVPPES